MKQEIITCNVCGRNIDIPNEEEQVQTFYANNSSKEDHYFMYSNYPSFLHLSIFGHGKLYANIQTEIDVCWQCIANKFVIKNGSKTEKGIGRICFTTGEQTDLGTAEIYLKWFKEIKRMSIKEMLLVFIICISPILAGIFVLWVYIVCKCICFIYDKINESFYIIKKQLLEKERNKWSVHSLEDMAKKSQ